MACVKFLLLALAYMCSNEVKQRCHLPLHKGGSIWSFTFDIKVLKKSRAVPVLPRHSERGGTPRVESPPAVKKY